jgi:phosphoketolase
VTDVLTDPDLASFSDGELAALDACPGLSFVYTHLSRLIRHTGQQAIYLTGPGHGGRTPERFRLISWCRVKLVEHETYVREHLQDLPEIRNWTVSCAMAREGRNLS